MRSKHFAKISRLWVYDETSGIKDDVERKIDPTQMINRTLI